MKKDKETPKWEKGPASDSRFFLSDFEKFPGIHKNKFSSQKKAKNYFTYFISGIAFLLIVRICFGHEKSTFSRLNLDKLQGL